MFKSEVGDLGHSSERGCLRPTFRLPLLQEDEGGRRGRRSYFYGSFASLLRSNTSRVRVSVFSLIITMLSTWYWPFTFLKSFG